MRTDIVADIEGFIADGDLWDSAQLGPLVDRLADGRDPVATLLSRPLGSLLIRQQMGGLADRTAIDVEAIVWPRLWKILEGVRAGVPDTELRVRIDVLSRRLARRFAEEAAG